MSFPSIVYPQPGFGSRRIPLNAKVLVIDDDYDTTELLKTILELCDFDVLVANSGSDGVELARSACPDVMVVDLLMPGMDGLEVCQAVRRFSNVPILMLTALGGPGFLTRALDGGADDYLVKPLSHNLLVASLNKLTRRQRLNQKML
jgi:DNA-binding response OmpR family regulator